VGEHQTSVLRLQPHMIPALRAAFSSAVNQVEAALVNLGRAGHLPTPWLGDEVSEEVAAHYTHRAMDAPDSSFKSLQQYRAELARIHDALQRMEDDYRRTEGDNEALWGRRA
jgi:hypothetical protein